MKKFDYKKYISEHKFEMGDVKSRNFENSTNVTEVTDKVVNEGVGNTNEIAEIFARYLIGDRETAIKQLRGQIKNSFGTMERGGSAEWNNQFRDLIKKLEQAIKSAL